VWSFVKADRAGKATAKPGKGKATSKPAKLGGKK
jgi:hypothetical protein